MAGTRQAGIVRFEVIKNLLSILESDTTPFNFQSPIPPFNLAAARRSAKCCSTSSSPSAQRCG